MLPMGKQFCRWFLAASAASMGLGRTAAAGVIEGAVTFPSQFVPSMTVYVSDLDTARVRSTQLARGQSSFTIEVPAGRYWVFLAPNEPGSPNIYGAYTQYSLCAHQASGPCDDHGLVAVAVSAKAPRVTVTIDDWYLPDDTADQIDRIRAVATGGVRVAADEPMGAPRFSEYPSEPFDAPATAKIDFSGSDLGEEDRENLKAALTGGPNFAGHLTAAMIRCGATCERLVLVDWREGLVRDAPPLGENQESLPCRNDEALQFRRDSRLLLITRARGPAVVTQYYVWNQKGALLVQSGEYHRTSQTFCAVAAR